jgi:pimeloyl-ACP methyl ester carboxylesterase
VTCPAATGHAPTHLEQEEQPLPTTIPGLVSRRIRVDHDIELNVAIGGSGPPLVLLHGFPQTHLMWRHVVAELIADHTVICPDLRGYGDSDKPVASDAGTYSKRTMAEDVVRVGRSLGHDRFALAGHDRGALVAIRAAMDHPAVITHLASLESSRRWTPGRCCTACARASPGTSSSWRSRPGCPRP